MSRQVDEALKLAARLVAANELRWLVNVMFGDPNPIPTWRFWLANLRWRLGL